MEGVRRPNVSLSSAPIGPYPPLDPHANTDNTLCRPNGGAVGTVDTPVFVPSGMGHSKAEAGFDWPLNAGIYVATTKDMDQESGHTCSRGIMRENASTIRVFCTISRSSPLDDRDGRDGLDFVQDDFVSLEAFGRKAREHESQNTIETVDFGLNKQSARSSNERKWAGRRPTLSGESTEPHLLTLDWLNINRATGSKRNVMLSALTSGTQPVSCQRKTPQNLERPTFASVGKEEGLNHLTYPVAAQHSPFHRPMGFKYCTRNKAAGYSRGERAVRKKWRRTL